jgi:signal transduction histidine kinase
LKRILSTGRSLVVRDTTTEPDWIVYPGTEALRSYASIPILVENKVIGALGLGKVEPDFFTEEHVHWAEALVRQAAVAIDNAWLFEQVRAGRERLQVLSRRLVEIQEKERLYIARELHDQASQALATLMLELSMLEREADDPQAVRLRLVDLKTITDSVLDELHRLAFNLRPASLDHLGLVPAVEQFINAFGQDSHLPIRLKTIGIREEERLPQELETTLYRIVQEALTNVFRHARASRADVLLERRGGELLVIVEDDGRGFDWAAARQSGRLGLVGMQERAEMLGGTLTVESNPGKGTTLYVEVPYADTDPDRG